MRTSSVTVRCPGLGAVNHAMKIYHRGSPASHRPRVMATGEQGNAAWLAVELGAVIHQDMQDTGYMLLKVRSFTIFRLSQGLHGFHSSPSSSKHGPGHRSPGEPDKFNPAFGKLADLIGVPKILQLSRFHGMASDWCCRAITIAGLYAKFLYSW